MSKAVEAEDLVIEFENQSGDKFAIIYYEIIGCWVVLEEVKDHGYNHQIGDFFYLKTLKNALRF